MSISRMTAVWQQSTHTGGNLLLLLALADNANEDGYCFPGIEDLCKRTRQSESTVIRRMLALEASGELVVSHSRRRGNSYLVVTGFSKERITAVTAQYFKTVKMTVKKNRQNDSSEPSPMTVLNSQNDSSEPSPVTDDPSITIIEPPKNHHTPADAGEGAGNPPQTDEERLPAKDAPHLYTVTEIQKLKLSRSDWELLLRNERLGLGKHGTRSSVVAHVEAKLALPVMEPLLDEMLVAVDAATVQSIDDPGMRAQFIRYVRNTLWVGEAPYTPAEVTRFAAEHGPVDDLYHLAGRLSKWRSAKRKSVKRGDEADNGKRYERPKQQQLTDAEYAALEAKYAPPS